MSIDVKLTDKEASVIVSLLLIHGHLEPSTYNRQAMGRVLDKLMAARLVEREKKNERERERRKAATSNQPSGIPA